MRVCVCETEEFDERGKRESACECIIILCISTCMHINVLRKFVVHVHTEVQRVHVPSYNMYLCTYSPAHT